MSYNTNYLAAFSILIDYGDFYCGKHCNFFSNNENCAFIQNNWNILSYYWFYIAEIVAELI